MTAPRGTPRRAPARRGGPPARSTRRHPRRLVVLLVVGGSIAVAAAFGVGSTGASPATSTADAIAAAVPTVAGADTVSTTWYCAEGTGAPGGRADETILIANEGDAEARAVVTVMPGGQLGPASRRVTVPRGAQVRVAVSSVLQAPEQPGDAGLITGPGVAVEVFGGRSVVEHEIEGESDLAVGPCARQAGSDWYFAGGTTERGAEENAALFNPFPDDAIVDLTFATDAGFIAPADLQAIAVPRRSRITVPISNFVRRQAQVALHAHVRTGRIVVERSLTFTAENETRRGLTLSLGAPNPETSWSLPGVVPEDGASHSLLVANFGPSATAVEVSPRFEQQQSTSPKRVPVGGRSVAAVDLASLAGSEAPFAFDVRTTRRRRSSSKSWRGGGRRTRRPGPRRRWRAPCARGAGRSPWAGSARRMWPRSASSIRAPAGRTSSCSRTARVGETGRAAWVSSLCRREAKRSSTSATSAWPLTRS